MNNFEERLKFQSRPTTFGELRNGDTFKIIGLKDTSEDVLYQKENSLRCRSTQDGVWKDMPANWPVLLVQSVFSFAA